MLTDHFSGNLKIHRPDSVRPFVVAWRLLQPGSWDACIPMFSCQRGIRCFQIADFDFVDMIILNLCKLKCVTTFKLLYIGHKLLTPQCSNGKWSPCLCTKQKKLINRKRLLFTYINMANMTSDQKVRKKDKMMVQ